MASFVSIRRDLKEIEREFDARAELLDLTKTDGGHLTNFGDDLAILCRKHGIKQSTVAKAFDVTAAAISRRYARKLTPAQMKGFLKPPAE